MASSSEQRQAAAELIHSAAIHLLRRARMADTESGLSPARLSALSVLVYGGPMTLTRLAAAEQVRPPTMSRIVAGLEGDGLVERAPHASDARAVTLSASRRGREVLEAARQRRLARLLDGLESASDAEVSTVRKAAEVVERLFGRGVLGRPSG